MAALKLDEHALANYLQDNIKGFTGPLTAKKFSGGQSNPTYLIEAQSGKYVLRRKPPGELLKSAHAVDREFKVISALVNSQVPVAEAYHLCADDSVIGSIFYVMEYVDGRVFWDPQLPELNTNEQRAAVYDEMNRVLVAIHSVDIEAQGLADYGRAGNYYERQIQRWISQYRASETQTFKDMDYLIDWLPKNTPVDDGRVSLVHGDFRLDNMLFKREFNSAGEAQVLALVDWELSTLGHPFADLAYQCMQLRMNAEGEIHGLQGVNRAALGIPSEEEYVARYCQRMGIDAIKNWNFYIAFSAFRFAAILQGVKKRALDGNASNDKAHQVGEMVEPLAKIGVDLI